MRELVERLIKEMVGAAQARAMYGPSHKLTSQAVKSVHNILAEIFAEAEEITIGVIGDEIAFEKEPFYNLSQNISGFIKDLKDRKIEKITFLKAPDEEEVAAFMGLVTKNPSAIEGQGGIDNAIKSSGILHIFTGNINASGDASSGISSGDLAEMAKGVFTEGEDYLKSAFADIAKRKTIDLSAARLFVVKLISSLARNRHSLLMLTSIKSHDEYTFIHSINVSIFSVIQAEALRLGERALTEIGIAGLLHDSGKLALSSDILQKPKALDERDIEEMHKHPVDGAKLLLETVPSNPLSAIAAFEHHIRFDQGGYPRRIFGGPVNPASIMVSIADVYDALRSKRAYHEDMAPEKTYEEMMKLSGKEFDPKLLANFFKVIGIYPPGTLVELDDGSIAIVLKESAIDMNRPQVEILYDGSGNKMSRSSIVNLLEKDRTTQKYKRSIVKSVAAGKVELPGKYNI